MSWPERKAGSPPASVSSLNLKIFYGICERDPAAAPVPSQQCKYSFLIFSGSSPFLS